MPLLSQQYSILEKKQLEAAMSNKISFVTVKPVETEH
jgi:hypothetical protein